MKVIVTGGGTGGHIYPALAIADKIKEKEPESQILYVGSKYGLETKIVPDTPYGFETLPVQGRVPYDNPIVDTLQTGYAVASTAGSVAKGLRILNRFKPDAVIGTGGYVSLPIMKAAQMTGVKTYIHEQNAFPGTANRFLAKKAEKIFLGFQDADKIFKDKEKLIYTGNPVRKAFYETEKKEARKELNIPEDDFVIFAFGGSQGAGIINEIAIETLKKVNGLQGYTLIFGTGPLYYGKIGERLESEGIELKKNILMKDYIKKMEQVIAVSDIVIARSGALSLAEITVSGRPSVLIPFPAATDNHQYYNAKSVADKGGAIVIEEKDVDPRKVAEDIMNLSKDSEALKNMAKGAKAAAPPDAAEIIYEHIRMGM